MLKTLETIFNCMTVKAYIEISGILSLISNIIDLSLLIPPLYHHKGFNLVIPSVSATGILDGYSLFVTVLCFVGSLAPPWYSKD